MKKKILRIFIMLLISVTILSLLIEACRDDVILDYVLGGSVERYYKGTGHSGEVILKEYSGHDGRNKKLRLDNFTNDAYDIKVHTFGFTASYWWDIDYWLSFNYETFSSYCSEADESKIALPYILNSPKWWPHELGETIIPSIRTVKRSNYKFYCCRAKYAGRGIGFFEYFAIDNVTKKGYYWRTMRNDMPEADMQKYF